MLTIAGLPPDEFIERVETILGGDNQREITVTDPVGAWIKAFKTPNGGLGLSIQGNGGLKGPKARVQVDSTGSIHWAMSRGIRRGGEVQTSFAEALVHLENAHREGWRTAA